MLDPKKINAKKGKKIMQTGIIISIFICIFLFVIQKIVTPQNNWSIIVIACFIYTWVITIYSIKTCQNVASYVFLQMISVSALLVVIDYFTGFYKWSFNIAIPIIIITANTIMLILTILSRKKYIKYVIYQILICLISYLPILFITEKLVKDKLLTYIALGISILNCIVFIILCHKDIKEGIKRKLHL